MTTVLGCSRYDRPRVRQREEPASEDPATRGRRLRAEQPALAVHVKTEEPHDGLPPALLSVGPREQRRVHEVVPRVRVSVGGLRHEEAGLVVFRNGGGHAGTQLLCPVRPAVPHGEHVPLERVEPLLVGRRHGLLRQKVADEDVHRLGGQAETLADALLHVVERGVRQAVEVADERPPLRRVVQQVLAEEREAVDAGHLAIARVHGVHRLLDEASRHEEDVKSGRRAHDAGACLSGLLRGKRHGVLEVGVADGVAFAEQVRRHEVGEAVVALEAGFLVLLALPPARVVERLRLRQADGLRRGELAPAPSGRNGGVVCHRDELRDELVRDGAKAGGRELEPASVLASADVRHAVWRRRERGLDHGLLALRGVRPRRGEPVVLPVHRVRRGDDAVRHVADAHRSICLRRRGRERGLVAVVVASLDVEGLRVERDESVLAGRVRAIGQPPLGLREGRADDL